MSTTTENLGLFKYDPSTDGAQTFNIEKALNENWDKIDEKVPVLDEDGKVPASQLPDMDYIPTSEKGAASGVASLGEDGKVPESQLPTAKSGNLTASMTGVLQTSYSTIGESQYGSSSTFNTNTVLILDPANGKDHWNSAEGDSMDVCFRFGSGVKEAVKTILMTLGSGYALPTVSLLYEDDSGNLVQLEELSNILIDNVAHEYTVNANSIKSNLWVLRFTVSDWVNLKSCNVIGESKDGILPCYEYNTVDLTAGVSPLETGKLYFVYE